MVSKDVPISLILEVINFLFIIGAGQPIIVTTVVPVGPGVTHMVCPHCHAEIDTAVRTEPGLLAWLSGGLLLLMGYER